MAIHPVPLQDPLNRRLTSGYEYARSNLAAHATFPQSKQHVPSRAAACAPPEAQMQSGKRYHRQLPTDPSLGVDFAQELFAVPLELFLPNALNIQELGFVLRAGKAHGAQGRI